MQFAATAVGELSGKLHVLKKLFEQGLHLVWLKHSLPATPQWYGPPVPVGGGFLSLFGLEGLFKGGPLVGYNHYDNHDDDCYCCCCSCCYYCYYYYHHLYTCYLDLLLTSYYLLLTTTTSAATCHWLLLLTTTYHYLLLYTITSTSIRTTTAIAPHHKHRLGQARTYLLLLTTIGTTADYYIIKGSLVRNFRSYEQLDSLVKW